MYRYDPDTGEYFYKGRWFEPEEFLNYRAEEEDFFAEMKEGDLE